MVTLSWHLEGRHVQSAAAETMLTNNKIFNGLTTSASKYPPNPTSNRSPLCILTKNILITTSINLDNNKNKKMETKFSTFAILLLLVFSISSYAQNIQTQSIDEGGEYPISKNDANNPCITPEQYKIIEKQCVANIKLLGLENVGQKGTNTISFIWPLKTANSLNDCSYYYIGNYLDQDATSPGIKDWNCGSVTSVSYTHLTLPTNREV